MNAQTKRIRETLGRCEPMATARGRVLGQVLVCEGCCCGRTDKGFAPVPRDWIKQQWKDEKLNKSVQLTISGCLGPCDLANVVCVVSPKGLQWLGGLQEQWQFDLLLDWARASRDAGVLLELPAELSRHRFERFAVEHGSLADARGLPVEVLDLPQVAEQQRAQVCNEHCCAAVPEPRQVAGMHARRG